MEQDDLGAVGETKPWYASKTIIGAAVTALALVAGFFGVTIDEATKQVLIEQSTALLSAGGILVGVVLTIVGRVTARKAIG